MAEAVKETEEPAPEWNAHGGTFESLKVRNFRLLFIGTTLANAAQWIQQVTLSWIVYDWTGSGTMLGTINIVRSVATVGLAPVSGTIIDRFPRRRLMIITNAWLLLTSLLMGLILISGQGAVWQLYVFTFMGGLAQVIDMPLRQTIVFTLVPRALAANAVALVQTGGGLMRSIGPSLGGFLILWFGPGGNFLVQALAYGLIAFNTLRIQFPPHKQQTGERRPMLQNMKEGFAYVAGDPVTRTFLMMGWIMPLFIIPNFVTLPPIYAKTVFGGGPQVLGVLLSAIGIGAIVGGLVSASLSRVDRRGLVQICAMLMLCVSLVIFAFTTSLFTAVPALALAGFFEMIFLSGNQTLLQLSIPDDLRGRVTSLTSLNTGLSPIGAIMAGVGSDLIGTQEVTIILSCCAAVAAVAFLLFAPVVRNYSMRRAIDPATTSS